VAVMDLTLSHTFLNVHDIDLALAFYRDVLELDVHTDVTMDDFRWVTVSPRSQPDLEIGLMNPYMGPGAPDADAVLTLTAKGSMNGLIFATPDVDADFEKIRAAGAEVLQEPITQPYGVRDCAFRDPSGNMIRLSQSS
jgi:catechol 2,3-dioxygenase-like lactoylglutathione lyase family enzyme